MKRTFIGGIVIYALMWVAIGTAYALAWMTDWRDER